MVKVFMPAPGENWVGDITTAEFHANTRHQMVSSVCDADVVWLYSKWIHDRFPKDVLRTKPVITTVHHIVPNKPINIRAFDDFTDVYHVPNSFTHADLRCMTMKPIRKLPYWINDAVFMPASKLPTQKLVIGSFQRDTEGHDLRSPKLEKGPDVLAAVLGRLDPSKFKVLLGGWRRQYIINEIKKLGLEYEYRERAHDIAELYRQCDYYLITSRYEGGPQAVLEASQMRVKVLSSRMGCAPEMLHPDCICDDVYSFGFKLSNGLIDHTVEPNFQTMQGYLLKDVIVKYDDLIDEVFNESLHKP